MITTKIINEWIDLYNQGYSCYRISKLYKCSRNTVTDYLHLRGIKTPQFRTCYRRPELYKNKYIICLYDLNGVLCYQFDTAHEMAETFKVNLGHLQSRLSNKKLDMKYRVNNKWYRIHLIDTTKEE